MLDAHVYSSHSLRSNGFVFNLLELKRTVQFSVAYSVVSVGSIDAAIVTPRQTFLPLLKHSQVEKAIFVHNHPSGDPTPSREDITISNTLKKVGEIIGVEVLDSIVCGMNSYCSLAEQGFM
ncbi:hypothetical protein HN020_21140 [Brevibacillus borstelensis]|uniref:JAB domain-containing protein n=1 Tax=Brevibacillus borstelensis TaxID=45462 RepID=UPI00148FEE61|nr:JAB domain-containing protein [Brevibacillus borstelensis]NOU57207.1 hypothetical protein [Brevibacillus borstelensis]